LLPLLHRLTLPSFTVTISLCVPRITSISRSFAAATVPLVLDGTVVCVVISVGAVVDGAGVDGP
jgi:hypothetical protein